MAKNPIAIRFSSVDNEKGRVTRYGSAEKAAAAIAERLGSFEQGTGYLVSYDGICKAEIVEGDEAAILALLSPDQPEGDDENTDEASDENTDEALAEALAMAEEGTPRSVVKNTYKRRYAERYAAKGRGPKVLARSCGDWLAETLAKLVIGEGNKLDVEAFEDILSANGVQHAHWNRTTKGWQGRLRMTGRLALQTKVAEAGVLVVPGDEDRIPPRAWVERIAR